MNCVCTSHGAVRSRPSCFIWTYESARWLAILVIHWYLEGLLLTRHRFQFTYSAFLLVVILKSCHASSNSKSESATNACVIICLGSLRPYRSIPTHAQCLRSPGAPGARNNMDRGRLGSDLGLATGKSRSLFHRE